MNERKIEPRYGCEAYVSQSGRVCISQDRNDGDSEHIIILHPEEALELIEHLKAVYSEALDYVPEKSTEA